MNDSYAVGRQRLLPTTTDASEPPGGQGTVQKLRCRLGMGGSTHEAGELGPLLRYRLRVVTLITTVASGIFLLRSFVQHGIPEGPHALDVALHCVVVAITLGLCCVLWTSYPLGVRALRIAELVFFGVTAAYFAFVQIRSLESGEILAWVAPGHEHSVVTLASMANNLRWFVIIVLYGTFVPNTWKRCALVVGLLSALPLGLSLWSATVCPVMSPVTGWSPFFNTCVIIGMAAATAIFGSYKISVLQREAVVARELGQYRLRTKLGSGGMGEVYLAEHIMLRRKCALKLVRPDQTADPSNLERFEREVQSMAALTHANTVEVYDYGHADDGTFYYVMEYLPGLSLQELVEKHGPLAPERAVHFLRQICGALQEAHAVGLIHRDIKPSNVIASERGGVHDVAKLLDFGLVQSLTLAPDAHKLTVQGVILGSPPYMAPEQALGRLNLDSRTDIYSLGAVAYFLLTGQPPFIRETPMELLVAHAHEKPTPVGELRSELPADLQDIVMRCLEKEPNRRFADADALEQALGQCGVSDLWTRQMAECWWKEWEGADQTARVAAC
jgi:serine/threonine-protein kinase